jgi:hypothetical protein
MTYKNWSAGISYVQGVKIIYENKVYMCVQGHTAIVSWEPSKVLSLWTPTGEAPTIVVQPPVVQPPVVQSPVVQPPVVQPPVVQSPVVQPPVVQPHVVIPKSPVFVLPENLTIQEKNIRTFTKETINSELQKILDSDSELEFTFTK